MWLIVTTPWLYNSKWPITPYQGLMLIVRFKPWKECSIYNEAYYLQQQGSLWVPVWNHHMLINSLWILAIILRDVEQGTFSLVEVHQRYTVKPVVSNHPLVLSKRWSFSTGHTTIPRKGIFSGCFVIIKIIFLSSLNLKPHINLALAQ